jgi:hypothetical protein
MSSTCNLGPWFCDNIEVWNLGASLLTPLVAGIFAIWVARAGVFTDKAKTINQELIKQRLSVYKDVAPQINRIYCYLTFVGNWKKLTPTDVLESKREADREMHIYRILFRNDLFQAYRSFILASFVENTGYGEAAKVRLPTSRAKDEWKSGWQPEWESSTSKEGVGDETIHNSYEALMRIFARELGAPAEPWEESGRKATRN